MRGVPAEDALHVVRLVGVTADGALHLHAHDFTSVLRMIRPDMSFTCGYSVSRG